jgi:hypothetical protein
MVIMNNKIFLDNGGRRSGTDRRRFSYAVHIPERRSSIDRREGLDRRSQQREQIYHIKEKEEQEQAV